MRKDGRPRRKDTDRIAGNTTSGLPTESVFLLSKLNVANINELINIRLSELKNPSCLKAGRE